MRVFKTKWFRAFAKREGVTDETLCEAVRRAERGLIDADLGLGIIKQRVARPGQGKRGGYRMLMAYQPSHLALFLYGFAKNELDNIKPNALEAFRAIAQDWFAKNDIELQEATGEHGDEEIQYGEEA